MREGFFKDSKDWKQWDLEVLRATDSKYGEFSDSSENLNFLLFR